MKNIFAEEIFDILTQIALEFAFEYMIGKTSTMAEYTDRRETGGMLSRKPMMTHFADACILYDNSH